MRDISKKIKTLREATAVAKIRMSAATIALIKDEHVPKGNPFEVAKVAAIQAAKNTSQIIPYCHPLPIDFVGVEYEVFGDHITVKVTVKAIYKTGVEMEALTGASVAALTLYDMLKMLDEQLEIDSIKLLEKKGGKSDFKDRFLDHLKAAVIVMSDSIAAGKKEDASGKMIVERLEDEGVDVVDYKVIPDENAEIEKLIKEFADKTKVDMIITTGGTGLSPRDTTPDAIEKLIEKEVPGIVEAARAYGQERTPFSMLSRGIAGMRGNTLIITLPGSRGGVHDSMDALFPAVLHAFNMMRGGGHAHGHAQK